MKRERGVLYSARRFTFFGGTGQAAQIIALPRESYAHLTSTEETMTRLTGMALEGKGDSLQITKLLVRLTEGWCRTLLLESEEYISQLEQIKADVLIMDYSLLTKCPYLVSFRFRIPAIAFGAFVEPWLTRIPYMPF